MQNAKVADAPAAPAPIDESALPTPGEMTGRFAAELAASLREPRIATQLTEGQQVTMALGGSQELRAFLAGQMKTWGAVAREFDIKRE